MAALSNAPHPSQWAWCKRKWVMAISMGGSSITWWVWYRVGVLSAPWPQAQGAGYTCCTSVGASKVTPEPGCPLRAPRLPDEGRRVGLVKGESDDGGLLEVLEVLSSRPCSVSTCCWSWRCCCCSACSWVWSVSTW